jgi:hypothetical protein
VLLLLYERVAKISLGNYKKEEKHDMSIASISKLGGLEIWILTESFVFDINYV